MAVLYRDMMVWESPFVSEPKIRKSLSEDGMDQKGIEPFLVNNATSSFFGAMFS